jgi:hypothetical protein
MLLVGTGVGAAAMLALRRVLRVPPPAPPPTPVGGPLDGVNEHFHDAYDEARRGAQHDVPVLIVLADAIILFRDGARSEVTFTPRAFHVIKSIAHAPVAIFAMLHGRELDPRDGALDGAAAGRLRALLGQLDRAEASLQREALEPDVAQNLRDVHRASADFVMRVLRAGATTPEDLAAFAGEIGPALLRTTDDATRVQLDALHASVLRLIAPMTNDERATFQVVVTGDHQARVRSLGMQYFEKLLGEPSGVERRVTYAEGIVDEASAHALVGTRRLDRAIASAFFKDDNRLQRDVLGDAVKARLETMPLAPLA